MLKSHAVDFFKTARNVAKALGLTPSAIAQWGEDVPDKHMDKLLAAMKAETDLRKKEAALRKKLAAVRA